MIFGKRFVINCRRNLLHGKIRAAVSLILMVIRLVAQSDTLSLELLAPLPVNLQAALIGLRQSVVTEDPAHVMEHPTDAQHQGRLCRSILPFHKEPCIVVSLFRCFL